MGGVCVVRESIALPPDIRQASRELVEAIDLDGYSLVEFRRDERRRPVLMEVNPRLNGSVELAVRCGVDFPLMLWQWVTGKPVKVVSGYKVGVRLRWLAGDVHWLLEALRFPERPGSVPSQVALKTFATDFFRRAGYDCFDWREPGPAVADICYAADRVRRSAVRVAKDFLEHRRPRRGATQAV
jgi:predicted ATP-grasp superfamily ATP-dependent carboligase